MPDPGVASCWTGYCSRLSGIADLSGEERRFLLQIGEVGVVTFNPREDEVIAHLLDMGLIDAERIDDQTALLRHSPDGQTLARLRDNMG